MGNEMRLSRGFRLGPEVPSMFSSGDDADFSQEDFLKFGNNGVAENRPCGILLLKASLRYSRSFLGVKEIIFGFSRRTKCDFNV